VEVAVAVTKNKKQSHALKALTLATLALPGVNPNALAAEAEYFDLNTMFSRYSESGNRMKVEVYQATAAIPINDKFSLKVNGVKDIISGASPIYYYPKSGQLKMQKSQASIHDVRDSQELASTYTYKGGSLGLGVGRSSENDYDSNYFNIDSRTEFNSKRTVLATGYGFSSDQVWAVDHCDTSRDNNPFQHNTHDYHCILPNTGKNWPAPFYTQDGMYKRPGVGGDKSTHQGLLGVTQILNKDALIQSNFTYSRSDGYLSDPYKEAFAPGVPGTPVIAPYSLSGFFHDSRPDSRDQFAFLTRYVQHFSKLNSAAMHVDYRYYADTWGVDAHTFEFAWVQPIYAGWEITPRGRYYTQGSADFYAPYFTAARADGHYSSDYRLAQFGAFGGGVQINKQLFDHATLGFGIDFYERKENYSLSTGKGTGLDNYSFSLFSANVKIRF